MKRGEIWTAASGADYVSKPRPVVIIQDDLFADRESVTVILLTSQLIDADRLRMNVQPSDENGLTQPSALMIDKIMTYPRAKLGARIGALTAKEMTRVNRAVILFLGLVG